jgi:hypothetical protein
VSTEREVRKKEERVMCSLCSGKKSHLSGPEMHGKAKTSAKKSEWNVGKHVGVLNVSKCSNAIELRYL